MSWYDDDPSIEVSIACDIWEKMTGEERYREFADKYDGCMTEFAEKVLKPCVFEDLTDKVVRVLDADCRDMKTLIGDYGDDEVFDALLKADASGTLKEIMEEEVLNILIDEEYD